MELTIGLVLLVIVMGFIIKGLRKANVKLELRVKVAEKETKQTLTALKKLERLYDEVIKDLPADTDALNALLDRMSRDEDSGD